MIVVCKVDIYLRDGEIHNSKLSCCRINARENSTILTLFPSLQPARQICLPKVKVGVFPSHKIISMWINFDETKFGLNCCMNYSSSRCQHIPHAAGFHFIPSQKKPTETTVAGIERIDRVSVPGWQTPSVQRVSKFT